MPASSRLPGRSRTRNRSVVSAWRTAGPACNHGDLVAMETQDERFLVLVYQIGKERNSPRQVFGAPTLKVELYFHLLHHDQILPKAISACRALQRGDAWLTPGTQATGSGFLRRFSARRSGTLKPNRTPAKAGAMMHRRFHMRFAAMALAAVAFAAPAARHAIAAGSRPGTLLSRRRGRGQRRAGPRLAQAISPSRMAERLQTGSSRPRRTSPSAPRSMR